MNATYPIYYFLCCKIERIDKYSIQVVWIYLIEILFECPFYKDKSLFVRVHVDVETIACIFSFGVYA